MTLQEQSSIFGQDLAPPRAKRKTFLRRVVDILAVAAALWVVFGIAGRILPPLAVKQIEGFTKTQIETDSVVFRLNGSVMIRGLRVKPQQDSSYDNTILKARRVYARFRLGSLLLLNPKLKKISVRDFVFDAQHDLDTEQWNIDSIRVALGGGRTGGVPKIRLKNGRLKYSKVRRGVVKTVAAVPVDVNLHPSSTVRDSFDFQLVTGKRDEYWASKLTGSFRPGVVAVAGGISSEILPGIQNKFIVELFAAEYKYDKSGDYELKLQMQDVKYMQKHASGKPAESPEFLKKVAAFTALQDFIRQYCPTGRLDFQFDASGNKENLAQSDIRGSIVCQDVNMVYSVFPYALENLTGKIEFTEKDLKVTSLQGRHGEVRLEINGDFDTGSGKPSGELRITSDNMRLDKDLYAAAALMDNLKKLWDDFEPTGKVVFEYVLALTGDGNSSYALDVDLLDVNSTYVNFPYPLDHLTGHMFFDQNSIKVTNLLSEHADRKININGMVTETNTNAPQFDLRIDVNDVALDEMLVAALPIEQQRLWHQFEPSGFGSGTITVKSLAGEKDKADFLADLEISQGALRPKELDDPIRNVQAHGKFRPDSMVFERFEGTYNDIPVAMQGRFEPADEGKDVTFDVTVSSQTVEPNEGWSVLAIGPFEGFIERLKPRGKLRFEANVRKTRRPETLTFDATVHCQGLVVDEAFGAPALKNVHGLLRVSPGTVVFDNLVGDSQTDQMSGLNVNGHLKIGDTNDPESFITEGLLDTDVNLFAIAGKSLRDLRVELRYNPNSKAWESEKLLADFYEGKLSGKVRLEGHGDRQKPAFELQAGFERAQLEQFMADRTGDSNDPNAGKALSSGVMSGSVYMIGLTGQVETWQGTCNATIEDMRAGKLSLVGKLLAVLKLTKPTDYAFGRMQFQSHIKAGKAYIDALELKGTAASFSGTGWLDLKDRTLELSLTAREPRIGKGDPGFIESLGDALSAGVVRVEVTGDAYDPKVAVKPLPVVEGALELLGTKKKHPSQ